MDEFRIAEQPCARGRMKDWRVRLMKRLRRLLKSAAPPGEPSLHFPPWLEKKIASLPPVVRGFISHIDELARAKSVDVEALRAAVVNVSKVLNSWRFW